MLLYYIMLYYMVQGKILHTRDHKSEIPLENATEHPLANATENPR